MKASTKDKAQGKMHQLKGAVKEVVGKVFKNNKLEVDGKIEKSKGKIQEKMGQAEKVVGK